MQPIENRHHTDAHNWTRHVHFPWDTKIKFIALESRSSYPGASNFHALVSRRFHGKCPRMCLKINLSVKTWWHRPSMVVTRSGLWALVETEYNWKVKIHKDLRRTKINHVLGLRVKRENKRWFLDVLRADVSKISAGGLHSWKIENSQKNSQSGTR